MKKAWILFILLLPFCVFGQPQGKLFIHSGFVSGNELGYIQYPQNQYHMMDTIDMDDMIIVNDTLLLANGKIYFYDLQTLSRIDSMNTIFAGLLAYENNKLIIAKTQPPFLEVYNLSSKNLLFSLGVNKIKTQPIDILVDMNRVYLLYDTSIVIVDLNLQDTIASVVTSQPYGFPAYNQYLINKGNKIYIDAEIASGAPRFSILSLDKSSLQVENVLFQEFVETPFKPVMDGNKMYMSFFPSYYDIVSDTFIYVQNGNMAYPLCFDAFSNTFFLYSPLNFTVSSFNNNTYGTVVSIPAYLNKAVYYNEGNLGLTPQPVLTSNILMYPNPANHELNILLPFEKSVKEIRIIAMNGDKTVIPVNHAILLYKIEIASLSDGMYFLEIEFEEETLQTKFVKVNAHR